MQVTVHDTIDDIGAVEWDRVFGPERLFQSHAWLRSSEGGALGDCTPKYIVIRDDAADIVVAVAAYIIPTSLVMFSAGPIKWVAERIQRLVPWFLRPRILECGSPLGPGNGIGIRPGAAIAALAPVICEALERLAASERVHLIVLRDFLEPELEASAAFELAGYARGESLPTMSLDIKWASYADYLASMTSRHRQKVRRGLALAEKSGLHARWTGRIGDRGERLARQRENVRQFATEYSREQLAPSFFAQLDHALGQRVRVLDVLKGETSVGHALVVDDGSILRWLSFGRETGGVRDGAYFLVLASIVELAISEGKSVLDMGMTTHGPKTDFGAIMHLQWMLLRFRGPLGKLLPLALNYLNPARGTATRHAFRDDGP
ncbi:peptidogalycan biosysnthesis protein [Devosia ginsengisoli]|uniref:GNAT family N-acetyltransferase n=1 Tax=Devosia ginsengisoli TaxID=400770 RepID=A0A5B8LZ42_9HYPH|nr:peptidogalycan biosysnthesis protein [Devosia ginsengisoli]QDZ12640.1 GNAT family N-acetyltransferase [Devosia ginsengisoli]